ncbi:hypothetical protein T265_03672 [Opisthorchis viverrini]|uniref:Uncharacterized protein n=1 Tax=Opisthorchis viverrini TaxID=6198 RepID=A0A074ZV88_OPIVI|nr:hypothetical protein T265_03672 [Opisthorchis viverrini]KER29762.1 hypothetical protein T265_03672 [Opisthorchis viverrini]
MHSFANKFGFVGDPPGTQMKLSFTIFVSSRMCCTRPPHVSVGQIFEISRHMYRRITLLTRLLKTVREPTTGFGLLEAHQTSCGKYTHLQLKLLFMGDSSEPHCMMLFNWMCCTQAASCFKKHSEIPRTTHTTRVPPSSSIAVTLVRCLGAVQQSTTFSALFGAYQAGVVSRFPSTLFSTWTQIGQI